MRQTVSLLLLIIGVGCYASSGADTDGRGGGRDDASVAGSGGATAQDGRAGNGGAAGSGGATAQDGGAGNGGAAGSGGAGSGSLDHDAGSRGVCPTSSTGPGEGDEPVAGDGRCAPPSAPAPTGCSGACWATPEAPGAHACPPSPADDYGMRCCNGSACAYDFGNGCGEGPWIPEGTTLAEASACEAAGAALGVVHEGPVPEIIMGAQVLYLIDRGNPGHVAEVSKATCQTRARYAGSLQEFAVDATGTLYVAGHEDASHFLSRIPPNDAATPIDIDALLGHDDVRVSALVPDEDSAWAMVSYTPTDSALETREALVELPCCGAPARVVEEDLSIPSHHDPVWNGEVIDGQLYVTTSIVVLDVGRMSSAFAYDPASGESTLHLDSYRGDPPFAYDAQRMHFRSDRALIAVENDTCHEETLVDRPHADKISAATLAESELFWAESYRGLDVQRIYRRTPGREPRLVASTSPGHPPVAWIGVDDTHVYWSTSDRIERALRP